jgi:hypothetical protein
MREIEPEQIKPLMDRPFMKRRVVKAAREAQAVEDKRHRKIRNEMVMQIGRAARWYQSREGICLWAFRMESARITAARLPDWWVEQNPVSMEILEKMRARAQSWPSGYHRGNFAVPLFALDALRLGCSEREVQCPCGSGKYMYVPGRCLSCKPVHELVVRRSLWKRIAESLDARMGRREESSGFGDEGFCYLVSPVWQERVERKKSYSGKRYDSLVTRATAPELETEEN